MSDAEWKTKYFAALRTLEDDERRTRNLEQALRRVVARLCIVARGQDDGLDGDLTQLAEATRNGAAVEELSSIAERLRDVVATVDHKTALVKAIVTGRTGTFPALAANAGVTLPTQVWTASCDAAALVLKQIARSEGSCDLAETLIAELRSVASDTGLADILTKIADALQKRGDELTRDRLQANTLLTEMTARLDEVTDFLTHQNNERESALGDADRLNSQVMQDVETINKEVRTINDINQLRIKIGERLEKIAAKAREFRAREEHRFMEQTALAQKMTARVAALERQTSELHRSLHQEQTRAQLDPLTGIPNRGAFDKRLAEELARWQRFRDPVAVLVWDLDRFKSINDTYGHRAGDRVLQEVSKCFATRLRTSDVLARFGGEEFVMLLVGTAVNEAQKVANKLRESVNSLRFQFQDKPVEVTVSCGLTELRAGDTAESVFDRADAALYRAKDGGRNLCVAA
jgi:diguanylate cyclase